MKNADDVVICGAVRTPLTKAKRGGFKDTPCEVMLTACLKGLLERTKVDPSLVEDIVVGNVNQPGAGYGISLNIYKYDNIPYVLVHRWIPRDNFTSSHQ